ncbi:hypothetical protein Clacol_007279 [Clathrus columnatus]|uniref:DNA-directed RNA polymerases I and III subunit RPAC1 n=1 Tax=Clathrus columnatus TaxID=1419009 RepID=A0AAV5AM71_9AGAM|nr:hypothetical protein Clacol_007279 [Clathrus columnatus]
MTIDDPRRLVRVHAEHVSGVASTDCPGTYPGEDHSWNLDVFKQNLQVKVYRLSDRSCEFDLVGVDASIANALRRILISEVLVPTVAIENVYVWNNTSVVVDEVLSHRLGLVPLNVDPALLEFKDGGDSTDRNTIVFKLNVACSRNPDAAKGETDPDKLYINSNVYSSNLVWDPQGEQADIFNGNSPAPTNSNILLAKLRPGQEIDMELHAIKGLGKEHAKWSPVATASYRLHPYIKIVSPIPPALIPKFKSCFSPGVIQVRKKSFEKEEAYVADSRKESMSREVFRHEEFEGKVELGRVRDWFIFNIESEGPYAPERLLIEAIGVMREKIATLRKSTNALSIEMDTIVNLDADVEMGGT